MNAPLSYNQNSQLFLVTSLFFYLHIMNLESAQPIIVKLEGTNYIYTLGFSYEKFSERKSSLEVLYGEYKCDECTSVAIEK